MINDDKVDRIMYIFLNVFRIFCPLGCLISQYPEKTRLCFF